MPSITHAARPTWPKTAGGWFDFWTGEHRLGGGSYDVPVTIETIPLHVRAGAILPLGPVLQSTVDATNECIDIYVAPGADRAFDLYEDRGLDNSYETGASSTISMRWDDAASTLTIAEPKGSFAGMRTQRRFILRRIGNGVAPAMASGGLEVTYEGDAITVVLTQ